MTNCAASQEEAFPLAGFPFPQGAMPLRSNDGRKRPRMGVAADLRVTTCHAKALHNSVSSAQILCRRNPLVQIKHEQYSGLEVGTNFVGGLRDVCLSHHENGSTAQAITLDGADLRHEENQLVDRVTESNPVNLPSLRGEPLQVTESYPLSQADIIWEPESIYESFVGQSGANKKGGVSNPSLWMASKVYFYTLVIKAHIRALGCASLAQFDIEGCTVLADALSRKSSLAAYAGLTQPLAESKGDQPFGSIPRCCSSFLIIRFIHVARDESPSLRISSSNWERSSCARRIWYWSVFAFSVDIVITKLLLLSRGCNYNVTHNVLQLLNIAKPRSARTLAGPLTKPLNEVTIMADIQSTQFCRKFQYRFLALSATERNVIHIVATTEHEARELSPAGCVMVFAGRLPVQGARHD